MTTSIILSAFTGYFIGSVPFHLLFKEDAGIFPLSILLILEASKGFVGILLLGLMGIYIGFISVLFIMFGANVPIIKNHTKHPVIDCSIIIGVLSYSDIKALYLYVLTYLMFYLGTHKTLLSTILSLLASCIFICNVDTLSIQYCIMLTILCIIQSVVLCLKYNLNTENINMQSAYNDT